MVLRALGCMNNADFEEKKVNYNIVLHVFVNTKKYHVFAPMGRFQLESIYLYFPPSSQLVYYVSVL